MKDGKLEVANDKFGKFAPLNRLFVLKEIVCENFKCNEILKLDEIKTNFHFQLT